MDQQEKIKQVYLWGTRKDYQNYQKGIELAGGSVLFEGDPQGCDALLLPGGGDLEPWRYGQSNRGSCNMDAERDEKEMELLELFLRQGKPVLGICRGLQVINVFFGGTLLQDMEGHRAVGGIDRYHIVQTADPQLRQLFGERTIVNSAHHQGIDRVGHGLTAVQWARDGVIEAVRHEKFPVWAVQWHPERLGGLGGQTFLRFWLEKG